MSLCRYADNERIHDGFGMLQEINEVQDKGYIGASYLENSHMPKRFVPPPDPYSAATQFGGVTDWYHSQGYREPDTVMSDSKDSTVTYMEISNPFEGLSDIRSPGVAPPLPDYVPGPEEPEQAPPLPDFVLELVYPEFMPPEDEVFPAEEQPLPDAVSHTADSPGYVLKSDSKEDPEEEPKKDPADYPADGGDDGDDEDESSDNDEDDVDIKGDEVEEHPELHADSIAVAVTAG
ncbi:hypothetical protein Tco_0405765 [Tanacetum coccineum]